MWVILLFTEKSMNPKQPLAVLLALALVLGVSPAFSRIPAARAETASVFNVDNVADQPDANPGDGLCSSTPGGYCTLRAAIMEANADPSPDLIFLPSATYQLHLLGLNEDAAATGDLDITHDLSLIGTGNLTAVDAFHSVTFDRAFHILNNSTVLIHNVYIWDGYANQYGGAIRIESGSKLTLEDSHVTTNTAGSQGGAIYNAGTLVMTNTRVDTNSSLGDGGGLMNAGTLTITGSSVDHNYATSGNGGGIDNTGSLALTDSTLDHNSASSNGGGLFNSASLTVLRSTFSSNSSNSGGGLYTQTSNQLVTLTNATLSGNWANANGGGLYADTGTASLFNATLAQNMADHDHDKVGYGGGVYVNSATLNARNTLIANNADQLPSSVAPDCYGPLTSQGYNLIQSYVGCAISGVGTGNILGQSALLGSLWTNGGPTYTHRLMPGSPAVDGGNPAGCKDYLGATLTADQRGVSRPVDGNSDGTARCDIGAFEVDQPYHSVYLPITLH
jgi:CSLREA domain-containing protein